jgi:uncharacterized protein (TIGR03067 family)
LRHTRVPVVFETATRKEEGWLSLEEHETPRTLTLTFRRAVRGKDVADETWAGVYELDGDQLKVCVGPEGNPPKRFGTKTAKGQILYVFRRAGGTGAGK